MKLNIQRFADEQILLDCTIISNDATYPFTYDSTTKKYTSSNAGISSSSASISISLSKDIKNVTLVYDVSSEANYDKATFTLNGTSIGSGTYSGVVSGEINLGDLTTSDVIMVTYAKDSSMDSNEDRVSFYLYSTTPNTGAIYCKSNSSNEWEKITALARQQIPFKQRSSFKPIKWAIVDDESDCIQDDVLYIVTKQKVNEGYVTVTQSSSAANYYTINSTKIDLDYTSITLNGTCEKEPFYIDPRWESILSDYSTIDFTCNFTTIDSTYVPYVNIYFEILDETDSVVGCCRWSSSSSNSYVQLTNLTSGTAISKTMYGLGGDLTSTYDTVRAVLMDNPYWKIGVRIEYYYTSA